MEYFKRTCSLILVIIFGLSFSLKAQNPSTAKVDSTFEKYMSNAWDRIRDTENSDSLQNVYSEEFYKYYQQHPQTKTGKDALSQAFMMWGNTGNAKYMNDALESLGYDSKVWGKIISSLGNIYYRNDSLDVETYDNLLVDLKDRLTDPVSKSGVIYRLLRAKSKDDKNEAKKLAQELVEINASEFFVDKGLGYLHELESLNVGQQAPEFSAQTIEGKDISLSDLNGQYVLLDFWATWCGPCLPEIPHLKALQNKYEDANFKIVGISLDRQKSDLTDFVDERNIDWPQILETEGWDGKIIELYNVVGIPRTYFINPQGDIVAKDLRGEEMVKEIETHMNK